MSGGFDAVARAYQALEFLAFGRDLERARFAQIAHLTHCRELLILGDGDGRFAQRVATIYPEIRLHCVDHSATMLALARERVQTVPNPERIRFTRADATTVTLGPESYDAVTTLFFLDCFTDPEVTSLVAKVSAALRPRATWLFADFRIAPRGFARLRSRVWVGFLYGFFRLTTDIRARRLPQSEAAIEAAGFRREASADFQAGLLRSAAFVRAADPA